MLGVASSILMAPPTATLTTRNLLGLGIMRNVTEQLSDPQNTEWGSGSSES